MRYRAAAEYPRKPPARSIDRRGRGDDEFEFVSAGAQGGMRYREGLAMPELILRPWIAVSPAPTSVGRQPANCGHSIFFANGHWSGNSSHKAEVPGRQNAYSAITFEITFQKKTA
jgi:hypothetical protein